MRTFEDIGLPQASTEPLLIKKTKTESIKDRMANTLLVIRPRVQVELKLWLNSFQSPMSKKQLIEQIHRLSTDDDVAIMQLQGSHGLRAIDKLIDPTPLLPTPLEEQMQTDRIVAITGKGVRQIINGFANDFDLMILDVDYLVTQCPTSNTKGKVPQIIQEASTVEILPIVGMEKIKSLNGYLRTVLDSLLQVRSDDKEKYTVLSWTVKNNSQIPILTQVGKIYSI